MPQDPESPLQYDERSTGKRLNMITVNHQVAAGGVYTSGWELMCHRRYVHILETKVFA